MMAGVSPVAAQHALKFAPFSSGVMRTARRLLAGFAVLASLCGTAHADITIRSAAQAGSAPKFIAGTPHAGRPAAITGYCIDLFRAIEQADPSIHIVGDQTLMTPSAMKHLMDTRDLDLACGWVHAGSHGDGYTFLEPALFNFRYVLAARAGDSSGASVESWDDVRRLAPDNVVLINHDWSQADWVRPLQGFKVDSMAYSPQSNLTKLLAGRGRFFFFREPGLSSEIASAGLQGKVLPLAASLGQDPGYLVLRKSLPEASVTALRNALQQLKIRGELAALRSRWSLEGAEPLQARK